MANREFIAILEHIVKYKSIATVLEIIVKHIYCNDVRTIAN